MDNNQQKTFEMFQTYLKERGNVESTSQPMSKPQGKNKYQRSGSSWGKKTGIPKTNVSGPKMPPTSGVPKGQYLSKTSSEVTNDPLSDKAYFPGPSEEFRAVADRKKIYSSCTVLPLLSEEIYMKAVAINPSYGKTVPRCAHDYYLAVMVYYRLLILHRNNGGNMSNSEVNFVDQIARSNLLVPKSLAMFIAGFGNFKAPSSREVRFGFKKPTLLSAVAKFGEREYEIPGYFGSIADNLGLYAGYPCLAVYYQRMLADLYRVGHPDFEFWDLPEVFRFDSHPINRNCLGYETPSPISTEQRAILSGAHVLLEDPEFDNSDLPINIELLVAVHYKLSATKIILSPPSEISVGSVGQLANLEVAEQTTNRAYKANYRAFTTFEVPSTPGILGSSFMYFPNKSDVALRIVKSLMPVTYRVNDPVSIASQNNLNILYTQSADFIKMDLFESASFSPSLRIENIVAQDVT